MAARLVLAVRSARALGDLVARRSRAAAVRFRGDARALRARGDGAFSRERAAVRRARDPLAVGAALTGGVASPLLPMGLPIVVSAAIVLESRRPSMRLFVGSAFASARACARCDVGRTSVIRRSSSITLTVFAASVAFTAIVMLRLGLRRDRRVHGRRARARRAPRRALHESEDARASLEGVAARLAHEVKNPLAAIKGLSVHMARSAADAKIAERLAIVAQEADRLQSIVDGFSRSRAGSTICASARDRARTRSRASSSCSSRRAARRPAWRSRWSATSARACHRRRAKDPPGAPQRRAQRDASVAARFEGDDRRRARDCPTCSACASSIAARA